MHQEGVGRQSCRGKYFRWRICGQTGLPCDVAQCTTQEVAIHIIFSVQNKNCVDTGGNPGAKVEEIHSTEPLVEIRSTPAIIM